MTASDAAGAVEAVVAAGGARPAADGPRRGADARRSRRPRRRCSPATPARRSPPAASACGRCSCASPPACPPPETDGSSAPRSRSSSSTPRRSSTTTCSTAPRCAAAGRRSSPPPAAASPPRPATCCSRARSPSSPRTRSVDAVRMLARASSELAAGELMQRADAWNARRVARALPRALPAEDRGAVPRRLRARRARGRRAGRRRSAAFGEQIGLAFQILDDVLDVSGPPERTGKPRGADLLDGTVTLPLILARAPRPRARRARPPRDRGRRTQAAEVCDRIAATGALEEAKSRRSARRRREGAAAGARSPQRSALELVADGVVERYA